VVDYSWLFELIVASSPSGLGLVGVVAYSTAMDMAITGGHVPPGPPAAGHFTLTILLTYAAMFAWAI